MNGVDKTKQSLFPKDWREKEKKKNNIKLLISILTTNLLIFISFTLESKNKTNDIPQDYQEISLNIQNFSSDILPQKITLYDENYREIVKEGYLLKENKKADNLMNSPYTPFIIALPNSSIGRSLSTKRLQAFPYGTKLFPHKKKKVSTNYEIIF